MLAKIIIFTSVAVTVLGSTVDRCDGKSLVWEMLENIPVRMRFYMRRTATDGLRECVDICYHKMHFCRSLIYVEETKTCHFSYWSHSNCTETNETDQHSDPSQTKRIPVIVCIRCDNTNNNKENDVKLAFSVDSSNFPLEDESLMPKKEQFEERDYPPGAVGFSPLLSPAVTANQLYFPDFDDLKTAPTDVKHNAGFKFLMPGCSNRLLYSTYPILNTDSFFSYISWLAVEHYEYCAQLCWRQHFCVSALFVDNKCLLSPIRGVCTDTILPEHYNGPVLISCMSCQ